MSVMGLPGACEAKPCAVLKGLIPLSEENPGQFISPSEQWLVRVHYSQT